MLRRLRRPAAAALCAALLTPALAACGDSDKADDPKAASSSDGSGPAEGELEGVTFEGDVGKAITASWDAAVEAPDKTTVTTLVKGDGDDIAAGDTVSAYLWVANGTTKKQVFSDYDNGAPESIPNNPDQLDPVFEALFEGQTYGSRVVAVTTSSEIFGENADESQTGVGATDSVVIVADLVEKQAVSPTPTDDKVHDSTPDTQPKIVEKDAKPSALDFSGIEEPALDTPVQRVVLQEGDGAAVKATDTITINYLGAVYDADAPFDESYSKGQPLVSPLSGLIQGWTIGLTGVKVGSRVLLQIPPAFGYGAAGSGESIPPNSTLWFVIDVQKAEAAG